MYIRRTAHEAFLVSAPLESPAVAFRPWAALAFVLAHVPLALAMQYGSSALTVIHAMVVIAVGVKWAVDGRRDPRVVVVVAYIAGCEVLWRMTNDRLYWETGKYAIVLVLSIAFIRTRGLRAAPIPVVYFLALLPSAALTLQEFDWLEAKNQLSFNLSGPLALMVAGVYFWDVRLAASDRLRVFASMIAPIVGVASIALVGILTTPFIEFTTESNLVTSGGFGPNQVSAALGLGALLIWLTLQEEALTAVYRSLLIIIMGWLIVQSAMTFSRGGLYGAALAAACTLPSLFKGRLGLRLLAVPVVLYLGWLIVWPALDAFTDGKLAARFQETELTNRADISENDFYLWEKYPVLGVGPGISRLERVDQRISHTEFTRLLSEHGSFGAVAMLVLAIGVVGRLLRPGPVNHKSMVASMVVWAAAYMGNSAMRIVAPSVAFGLAFSLPALDENEIAEESADSAISAHQASAPATREV